MGLMQWLLSGSPGLDFFCSGIQLYLLFLYLDLYVLIDDT